VVDSHDLSKVLLRSLCFEFKLAPRESGRPCARAPPIGILPEAMASGGPLVNHWPCVRMCPAAPPCRAAPLSSRERPAPSFRAPSHHPSTTAGATAPLQRWLHSPRVAGLRANRRQRRQAVPAGVLHSQSSESGGELARLLAASGGTGRQIQQVATYLGSKLLEQLSPPPSRCCDPAPPPVRHALGIRPSIRHRLRLQPRTQPPTAHPARPPVHPTTGVLPLGATCSISNS